MLTDSYWDRAFKEYSSIKGVFERNDRKIYNSTLGGKLGVFDRKPLDDIQ
jgi:hypothetical protein